MEGLSADSFGSCCLDISLFFTNVPLIHWMAIGMITAVMSVLGDLVESMFKRSIEPRIRVSSCLTRRPLDRFDGLLLSAPVVFVYLEMMMLI